MMFLVNTMEEMRENLYQKSFVLIFLGLFMVVLVVQILSSSTFLMLLPRPRGIIVGMILIFSLLNAFSVRCSRWITQKLEIGVPTVLLWMVPLLSLFSVYAVMLILLVGIHTWVDRAFWSTVSHLNAKMTTVMFTTTFAAFKLYIFIGFLGAVWHYLSFFLKVFEAGESVKERAHIDEALRKRAMKFNRFFFFSLAVACFLLGSGIVFFKPETILYYRGEIQIQSGVHPEAALEAFQHLVRKYPAYKFLDTVEYRAAWTIDRRLKKFPEAIAAYEGFLTNYGYQNVWANDVVANLVVIHLDKLHQPREALRWIERFEEKFPQADLLPHISLYKARALLQENLTQEAKQVLETARLKFHGQTLVLYDNEDNFITTLPFETAIGTLNR